MKALILLLTLLAASMPAAAVVNGYVPPDDSLDAVGAFGLTVRLGLDPQSPGAAEHDWYCAATLINPGTVIVAKHCLSDPPGSASYNTTPGRYAVRFRRNINGGIGTIEAGPGSYHHAIVEAWYLPSSLDVAVGYLTQKVGHIAPMPIIFEHGGIGEPITLAGWGRIGPGPHEGERIELRACDSNITALGSPFLGAVIWFPTAWDAPGPLCGVNSNDSGGALVLRNGAQRRLIGVIRSFSFGDDMAFFASDQAFINASAPW